MYTSCACTHVLCVLCVWIKPKISSELKCGVWFKRYVHISPFVKISASKVGIYNLELCNGK